MPSGHFYGRAGETIGAVAKIGKGLCIVMENLKKRLKECIGIQNILQKQMTVAGVVSQAFQKFNLTPVVVGGLAVEFYTLANYLTRDIDMIIPGDQCANEAMSELGFKKRGSTWILPEDPTIIVDFPGSPLGGSWDKVLPVELDSGERVYIISIEDIIIDRILAVKYWGDAEEWAQYMMAAHYDDIDWEYCLKRADQELCLDVFKKMKEWAEVHRAAFYRERADGNCGNDSGG